MSLRICCKDAELVSDILDVQAGTFVLTYKLNQRKNADVSMRSYVQRTLASSTQSNAITESINQHCLIYEDIRLYSENVGLCTVDADSGTEVHKKQVCSRLT